MQGELRRTVLDGQAHCNGFASASGLGEGAEGPALVVSWLDAYGDRDNFAELLAARGEVGVDRIQLALSHVVRDATDPCRVALRRLRMVQARQGQERPEGNGREETDR